MQEKRTGMKLGNTGYF